MVDSALNCDSSSVPTSALNPGGVACAHAFLFLLRHLSIHTGRPVGTLPWPGTGWRASFLLRRWTARCPASRSSAAAAAPAPRLGRRAAQL